MKNKFAKFLLSLIVLALSCTQVYAGYGNGNDFSYSDSTRYMPRCGHKPVSVPEPTTLALVGIGLLGVAFARKRKQ